MSRREALSLYRRIMRLHRQKLPHVHREVGDRYVRQEFRAHKDVSDEQHGMFMGQWEEYISHLTLEADLFGIGRDLADKDVESMTEEQRMQLSRLRDSAVTVGKQSSKDR